MITDEEGTVSMLAMALGAPEMIMILVVVLVLFGAKRLPELARSIGSSARELRKGLNETEEELSE